VRRRTFGQLALAADTQFVTVWNIGEIRNGEPVVVGAVE